VGLAALSASLSMPSAHAAPGGPELPRRIQRIVLHVPGSPAYQRPDFRFVFFTPSRTQSLWNPRFGAHWIVWTDGSVWPRHPRPGEPASWTPPAEGKLDLDWRLKLAMEAAPVYSHVHGKNSGSVGIEVAHSGHRQEPFPAVQVRSLAFLLRSLLEMSHGRLDAHAIVGHKDLDPRPAYVYARCERPGCPVFADSERRPYRRRVDPPEALFAALRAEGLDVPRPSGDGDAELVRAEDLPAGRRPEVVRIR
jgi:N-acetylmuramoyl-L-alanine amidase